MDGLGGAGVAVTLKALLGNLDTSLGQREGFFMGFKLASDIIWFVF